MLSHMIFCGIYSKFSYEELATYAFERNTFDSFDDFMENGPNYETDNGVDIRTIMQLV